MTKQLLLEDFPDEALDAVLSLAPKGKTAYFTKLAKEFYEDYDEESDEFVQLVECYVGSFYLEKRYRTNRFFNECFTPVYTTTGLIRNIWSDLFFADDDLITH